MRNTMSREKEENREGIVARTIEKQTAKLPSDVFLWGALGSMALSLILQLRGGMEKKETSNFIGMWVPTLLIFGLYNKIVKTSGHDQTDLD